LKLRVGQIPYLNSVLFYHALKGVDESGLDIRLEPLVPRALSGAALEAGVDCGPVPLVTCWDIEDRFEPLAAGDRGDFCIATKDAARSILLFSRRPFAELDGAGIGVTAETSTSVRLMKTLFAHHWRVRPASYGHVDWPNNDAFLLIGDEALIHRHGVKDYPYVADLGTVWREWTGLPFVFARWVVRRDMDPAMRAGLISRIDESVAAAWRDFERVVDAKVHELGMDVDEVREYLEGFHFRMTPETHEAVTMFRRLDAEAAAGEGSAAAQQGSTP
jgi:chorismate dehydratase